ncbi:MAG: DNA mismatch repair endonuclease MutL [Candidatus Saccharicenans sp.]|jgi:DNA mismatch repair protein MutL|nr:DNA mismatch repair endonuclease MutL [Candidatus Saccharicenans sp.]MDH7494099.1 DNA mismatch repair endonuclease MutL [Candidatus Saccharicenans sp.]
MGRIKLLPAEVASKIAAGEVVERPVSVVKELVENSLDAGATEIRVELVDGGKKLIRVQDNGSGLSPEDVALCFKRHATSKIRAEADLERIATLGFRGEALASISAVSRVTLKTSDGSGEKGYQVEREGEKLLRFIESAFPRGTMVEVRDLFFNLPARRKFLRSDRSELSLVVQFVTTMALAFPGVKFVLVNNNKEIINCPAVTSVGERVYQLFGKKVLDNLMSLDYEEESYRISGLSSRPFSGRLDRQHQFFFVNRRPVKDRMLTAALTQAYLGILEKQKNPEGFIFLDIPFEQVDVNVHPAKAEVRFRDPQKVFRLILRAVDMAAREESLAKPILVDEEKPEADATWLEGKETSSPGRDAIYKQEAGLGSSEAKTLLVPGGEPARFKPGVIAEAVSKKEAAPIKVLGQYLNSYIIAVSDEAVFVIDQHNAHERILFEKFRQLEDQRAWTSRQMLFPSVIDLTPKQQLAYQEMQSELERLGFRLEPMGGLSFALKEYPDVFQEAEASAILLSLLEEEEGGKFQSRREKILATMACKAAVKAGQVLTAEEMDFLASELFASGTPGLCPHGRPVVIQLDRSRIERTLGRQPE